ncbi:hypothetical protein [uncultured Eubacterium sp.]|uniref:hypothetical protein n=1 Tax=uncultured Eubacterium sp. TaxID=165185 RepID=UPI00259512A8|nr:hypothetical protein [uncultured Eubacterium sp.]
MYLLEKRIKKLAIKNIIFIIIAAFNVLLCGSYIISEFVYYRDDLDTAMHAVSMKSSIRGMIVAIILLTIAIVSRKWIGNARIYSSYFENDLDGYVTYHDLAGVTGYSVAKVRRHLHIFRKLYMKNYELKVIKGQEMVELYSKTYMCECKNCGGVIEKRVFFTGICSYCGSSDLHAKVLTDNRFYSIASDFKYGVNKPDYYKAKNLNSKKVGAIIFFILGAFITVIFFMIGVSDLSHYFDHEYQRDLLLSPDYPYKSYELIKGEILNSFIYDCIFVLVFAPLSYMALRRIISSGAANVFAQFFAYCNQAFSKIEWLPNAGVVSKPKTKLKEVRRTIHKGYLKHCSMEVHEGEVMVSLAKRIVKDTCPYCAAPIVGAVYKDYKCQYCDNMIMGVIEKKN